MGLSIVRDSATSVGAALAASAGYPWGIAVLANERIIGALQSAAATATLLLAGCSVGASPIARYSAVSIHGQAQTLRALTHPEESNFSTGQRATPVVYVSDNSSSAAVQVYDQKGQNQQPIVALAGLSSPRGITVDAKGVLWVADNDANIVYGFRPGRTKPAKKLYVAWAAPWAVAFADDGTGYVANQQPCCGNLIQVFPPGSKFPASQLGPGPNTPYLNIFPGLTVDAQGNLYGTYCCRTPSGGFGVIEYPKGTTTPEDLGISLNGSFGIQIASNGDIIVSDVTAGIEAYKAGSSTPYVTIPSVSGGLYLQIALRKDERAVYVADEGNGCVWEFAFPSGRILDQITTGLDTDVKGVALGRGLW
jgi:hypothetical protein